MKLVTIVTDVITEEVSVDDREKYCQYYEHGDALVASYQFDIRSMPHDHVPIKKIELPIIDIFENIGVTPSNKHPDGIERRADYYCYTRKVEEVLERPFRALVDRAKRDERAMRIAERSISELHLEVLHLGCVVEGFNTLRWWQRIRFLFNNIVV